MAHGLVLTGYLRSVKEVEVAPKEGEKFKQQVAVIDTGQDWLYRVVCPREQEAAFHAALDDLVGSEVAIEVTNGEYRRLWDQGLA